MPHPNCFGFRSRPGKVRPHNPRQPPVLKARFPSVPRLGFEHDSGRFAAPVKTVPASPGTGRGGFRMGRTQAHGVTRHAPCLRVAHPAGPAGQKRHSQPREGPRGGKGLVEEFAPDCAERTISAGTSRRFGVQCRSAASLWHRRLPPSIGDLGGRAGRREFVSMSHSPGGLGGRVSWMLHFGFFEAILPQYFC